MRDGIGSTPPTHSPAGPEAPKEVMRNTKDHIQEPPAAPGLQERRIRNAELALEAATKPVKKAQAELDRAIANYEEKSRKLFGLVRGVAPEATEDDGFTESDELTEEPFSEETTPPADEDPEPEKTPLETLEDLLDAPTGGGEEETDSESEGEGEDAPASDEEADQEAADGADVQDEEKEEQS